MAAAAGAPYFDAPAVVVRKPLYRARYLVVEARPSTSGVELVGRSVERGVTSTAVVGPWSEQMVVLPGERGFGPSVHDHGLLRAEERAEGRWLRFGHAGESPRGS